MKHILCFTLRAHLPAPKCVPDAFFLIPLEINNLGCRFRWHIPVPRLVPILSGWTLASLALLLVTIPITLSANFALGVAAYKEGDFAKAAVEFLIAAEKGDPLAQLNLGLLYDRGQGMEQDREEAVKWYRRSAENGNSIAQINLASMYFEGTGVKQDDQTAAEWYQKAALLGNHTAQYNLSVMFEEGIGVERDLVRAFAWLEIAARNRGIIDAEERQALAKKLSPDQIRAAKALFDEYFEPKAVEFDIEEPGAD